MEALPRSSAAALTVYDMCKAIDRGMVIGEIRLDEKRGGKSGTWVAADCASAVASLPRSVSVQIAAIARLGDAAGMSKLPFVLLVARASSAIAGPIDAPIVGGTPTTAGEYPNVVAIEVGAAACAPAR